MQINASVNFNWDLEFSADDNRANYCSNITQQAEDVYTTKKAIKRLTRKYPPQL